MVGLGVGEGVVVCTTVCIFVMWFTVVLGLVGTGRVGYVRWDGIFMAMATCFIRSTWCQLYNYIYISFSFLYILFFDISPFLLYISFSFIYITFFQQPYL